MWEKRIVYRVLAGKPEGKRPLVRSRHRWENNLTMDLKQDVNEWSGLSWLITRTSNGLLWKWLQTFGFQKLWGLSWLVEQLADLQGLSTMVLVHEVHSEWWITLWWINYLSSIYNLCLHSFNSQSVHTDPLSTSSPHSFTHPLPSSVWSLTAHSAGRLLIQHRTSGQWRYISDDYVSSWPETDIQHLTVIHQVT